MFEYESERLINRETGNVVRPLEPYCDLPGDAKKGGLKTADLIEILDANKEHTHYACQVMSALGIAAIVVVWRCDCFVATGGPRFYEAAIYLGNIEVACKADSHVNFALMLGSMSVTPEARWFPEKELSERLGGKIDG